MLTVKIPKNEIYDEENNEFINIPEVSLKLEHSLFAISKWESIWHKPFLSNDEHTREEEISYVECMSIDDTVDSEVYSRITDDNLNQIDKYMNDSMSAVAVAKDKSKSHESISSEVIYYWMAANNIPFECERWHLNRLFSLIYVCGIKNTPEKKRSESEIIADHRRLNRMRREALHTKG